MNILHFFKTLFVNLYPKLLYFMQLIDDVVEQIKTVALNTLRIEANAVQQLVPQLNDDFAHLVGHIFNSSGRVVVTGVGKSALIAQKIVATLNSTGTPAMFMHAADAIHGDLGMLSSKDIVICFSKK